MKLAPYSVLIRTRNSALDLPEVFQSLEEQTHLPREIVVVDNQSEDQTVELARNKGAVIIPYPSDKPFSYSHALNVGMRRAKESPYVLILSAHSPLVQPLAMEEAVKTMQAHAAAAVITFKRLSQVLPSHRAQVPNGDAFIEYISWNPKLHFADNSCNMIRTVDWLQKSFDESLPSHEDQGWIKSRMGLGRTALHQPEIYYRYANRNFTPEKVAFDWVVSSRLITHEPLRKQLWTRRLKAVMHMVLGNKEKARYNWTIVKHITAWRKLPTNKLQYHELVRPASS
jgi:glycosyltransferase involved in cell wall biosynthesis